MKISPDAIAKPAVLLVIFGVIKGYVRNSAGFMIAAFLTFPKRIRSIKSDLPKDIIASNAIIAHLYYRLRKRFSKDKAFEITRAAVLCSALAVMQANFRNVEAPRTFENLICYQKKAKNEGVTRLNRMRIIRQTEDCYEYEVTRCMFFEFFRDLGVPELTRIMCAADNAIFNTYLPNELVFERGVGETMPDGAATCRFCIRKG